MPLTPTNRFWTPFGQLLIHFRMAVGDSGTIVGQLLHDSKTTVAFGYLDQTVATCCQQSFPAGLSTANMVDHVLGKMPASNLAL